MNNQWEKSKEPESINLQQTLAHCSKVTSEIKGGILKQELCLFNYRHRGKLKLLFLSTLKGLTDSFGLRSTFTDVTGHQCTQSLKNLWVWKGREQPNIFIYIYIYKFCWTAHSLFFSDVSISQCCVPRWTLCQQYMLSDVAVGQLNHPSLLLFFAVNMEGKERERETLPLVNQSGLTQFW